MVARTPEAIERKRARNRERSRALTAAGLGNRVANMTDDQRQVMLDRAARNAWWKSVERDFADVMAAGGSKVLARADREDPMWRHAATEYDPNPVPKYLADSPWARRPRDRRSYWDPELVALRALARRVVPVPEPVSA